MHISSCCREGRVGDVRVKEAARRTLYLGGVKCQDLLMDLDRGTFRLL